MSLPGLVGPGTPIGGTADGTIDIAGPPANPEGTLKLSAADVRVGRDTGLPALTGELSGDWRGNRLALTGLVEGFGRADAKLTADRPLRLSVSPLTLDLPQDEPVAATLSWAGEVRPLWDLVAFEDQLTGKGALTLDAKGTLVKPEIRGQMTLESGEYENFCSGTLLQDVHARVDGDAGRVVWSEVGATDGADGRIRAAYPFSAVPTPLYVLYQARDGFGALMVTVIFAAYAAGVVASLFLAGHVSDWLGRRRMAAVAVAVNMASGALFLAWPSVTGLIAGRVISGISIGMLTATATAYLSELHAAAHPGRPCTRAEMVATTANLGGLGFGPLLAGFLAQYVGDPLRLPYLVAEALMLVGAISLALAPETVTRPGNRPAYRPQRVSVPVVSRSLFFAAGAAAAAQFALFGLFASPAPGVLPYFGIRGCVRDCPIFWLPW